jgi:hypothetical protein
VFGLCRFNYQRIPALEHYLKLGLYRIPDYIEFGLGGVMVFNTTFNNISVIFWRSVLLMEETGENHRPVASH